MSDDGDQAKDETSVVTSGVSAATLRVPKFCRMRTRLWFNSLEAQFVLNKITRDETKFSYVIGQLDEKYMEEVEDIITDPPEQGKYEKLKTELIKRLSDADGTRVRKLIESEEIGDRTPSQFWRHLKNLSGNAVNNEFLMQMWKNRLLEKVQLVLASILNLEPTQLAEVADRAYDISFDRGSISAVTSKPSAEAVNEQIKQLERRMADMASDIRMLKKAMYNRGRSSSRGGSRSRSRGGTRSNGKSREQGDSNQQLEDGKRSGPSVNAASRDGPKAGRIFITDKRSKIVFLIDTGADLCVFPRSRVRGRIPKSRYELFAANGTRIATYGTEVMKLNLSLRREFPWRFVIADIDTPIIGMDFLAHYNLLVDPRNRKLIDANTKLGAFGRLAREDEKTDSVKTIAGDSVFHQLLAKYPDLTRPPVFKRETVKHRV
ncbi:uncharacterized protein LOC108627369 [Ceratina calcarata]|uniref:Uncharacterized protein LOC108627369 n=1 Tax=Ceratina calcarata TaxID=156304 RepID=A0AAJ7J3X3_9HYME|nr:uncharacterized protein LOC108627369 [Ceratina calcarata]